MKIQKLINLLFLIIIVVLIYAYFSKPTEGFKERDKFLVAQIDSLKGVVAIMEHSYDSLEIIQQGQGNQVDSAETTRIADIEPVYIYINRKYENSEYINSADGLELDSIITEQLNIFRNIVGRRD